MFGYGARSAAAQQALEQHLLTLASVQTVAECSRALAARPHVAGTPGQAATRDYVLERMRAWGLEAEAAEYEVYLPHPGAVLLERLTPAPRRFTLLEPPLPEAAGSADPAQWPAWHGYAAAGDVQGELVYANYGRPEDLERLAALGVGLEGRIALVRYGEIFRGNKVLNVQQRGAVGCILYSDPLDDGYFRGDEFPAGPMRPARGVQRGSLNTGVGDPTAPGAVSLPGVARVPPEAVATLPRIPSVPVGHAVGLELLRHLRGPEVPQEWQGALPLRYHVGPGPAAVRLKVEHDGGVRRIWNTLGRLPGTAHPDEWIIAGAHRDAWSCGAVDNVSGVVSVLEAARVCAALARAGHPPRRTLLFATWDAEEWGLIGSAEWVEQHRARLAAGAVAYINQDVVASGPEFKAAASPSLAALVRDIARVVPSPDEDGRTVFDAWSAGRDGPPAVDPLGGGSDHEGFFLHLGIPAVSHGFHGRWGMYHSAYDTTEWLERFGDPGYRRHRATALVAAGLALRLANADALPLEYGSYGHVVEETLGTLRERAGRSAALKAVSWERVANSARDFRAAADALAAAAGAADWDAAGPDRLRAYNAAVRGVEPALLRPEGAAAGAGDPAGFARNLVFGVDPGSGYGGWVLPGLTGAVAAGDAGRLEAEAALLAERLEVAAGLLRSAAGHVAR